MGDGVTFKPEPQSIQLVAKEWPTPIIFTGGGDFADEIQKGKVTFDFPPESNPISRAGIEIGTIVLTL